MRGQEILLPCWACGDRGLYRVAQGSRDEQEWEIRQMGEIAIQQGLSELFAEARAKKMNPDDYFKANPTEIVVRFN
jgi:hypothetical protein